MNRQEKAEKLKIWEKSWYLFKNNKPESKFYVLEIINNHSRSQRVYKTWEQARRHALKYVTLKTTISVIIYDDNWEPATTFLSLKHNFLTKKRDEYIIFKNDILKEELEKYYQAEYQKKYKELKQKIYNHYQEQIEKLKEETFKNNNIDY